MGQAITEIAAYSGTISGTTKIPVSDSDTLQAATADDLKASAAILFRPPPGFAPGT